MKDVRIAAAGLVLIVAVWALANLLLRGCLPPSGPSAWGAPAPVPKALPVPRTVERLSARDLAEEWVLTWRGNDYRMTLSAFGAYRCWRPGAVWVGTWSLAEDGLSIVVSERYVEDDGTLGRLDIWSVAFARERGRIRPATPAGQARYLDVVGATPFPVSMRRPKKGE